jgi:hypothetical protein
MTDQASLLLRKQLKGKVVSRITHAASFSLQLRRCSFGYIIYYLRVICLRASTVNAYRRLTIAFSLCFPCRIDQEPSGRLFCWPCRWCVSYTLQFILSMGFLAILFHLQFHPLPSFLFSNFFNFPQWSLWVGSNYSRSSWHPIRGWIL